MRRRKNRDTFLVEQHDGTSKGAGVKEIGKRGKPVGKTTPKVQTATVCLVEYANKYADKLPNSTKLHLPSCLTKDSINNIMTEELEDKEEEIVSKSHFYYRPILRTCLSHIAIPPTSRFSKCNTCSKIKTQLGETKDKTKCKQLISLRQKHLMNQSTERRKYYKHSMKGRTEPGKYLSIILDGMDQKKTELPHYLYLSSFVSNLWELKTHLVGVIVHGIGNYRFFDYYQYPHGSNLTIHCLLSTLYMQKDSLHNTFKWITVPEKIKTSEFLFSFIHIFSKIFLL
ncbi:uncharacterized protein LOC123562861 [Mercenaria mercenaria]|uniref:uncharacterized protein LOC123562861 n=1 Tax=Mercenaria mercenaria TaxID=6596 RepID=UPI00234F0A58|nr:uncharacterized protein LOC123562861 [Mercenaria mercenaria]